MGKRPVFLLIDGSCLLTTAYYACVPPEILHEKNEKKREAQYSRLLCTSDGRYTNALYMMLRMFLNVVDHVQPTFLAIAFDVSRDTFRRRQYPFYKANRDERPVPLNDQFLYAQDIFRNMGCQVLINDDYEADDLIASVLCQCQDSGVDFIVYSKDHNFMQLVRRNQFLLRPMHPTSYKKLMAVYPQNAFDLPYTYFYDEQAVKIDTGVQPSDIVDLFSILGDPGDNIPGCKRVKKQAVGLINYYHIIEVLYEAIDFSMDLENGLKNLVLFWKKRGICDRSPINSLIKYKHDVFASKWLLTMWKDALPKDYVIWDFCFKFDKYSFYESLKSYEIVGVDIPSDLV